MTTSSKQHGKPARVKVQSGEVPVVTVRGDIDFRNAPEIKEAVRRLTENGCKQIDLQMSDVVFIDSSGISALLDSAKLTREKGMRLVLVSPTRQLIHLLQMSGFMPLFEFEHLPSMPVPPVPAAVRPPVYWQVSEFSVPCDPELVADIRRRVAQVAESLSFTTEEIEDIKLAVGEASTNAFRYGCPAGAEDTIGVRCIGESTRLTVEITDSGCGFDPSRIPEPPLGSLEVGGRGIYFMRLTMDEVEFLCLEQGTLVRMVKYVRTPA